MRPHRLTGEVLPAINRGFCFQYALNIAGFVVQQAAYSLFRQLVNVTPRLQGKPRQQVRLLSCKWNVHLLTLAFGGKIVKQEHCIFHGLGYTTAIRKR